MRRTIGILLTLSIVLLFIPGQLIGQELNIKLGYKHIIKSEILNEDREILVHLPENYDKSNKTYPVLYRLDGNKYQLLETVSVVNRLSYIDKIAPEMIIVSIVNIDRNTNMWPVNTKYYPEPAIPGANSFLSFIGEELVPYIDRTYRTRSERTICGQSLTGMFVLYAFLEKPELFDSYLAASGGFPACGEYFYKLITKSLMETERFTGKKIFISNGLKDPLDPDGILHKQILEFSDLMQEKLGDRVSLKYLTYKDEGHVPFNSYYDGLKFLNESDNMQ